MPVPAFHKFFRPVLELLSDGMPRKIRETETDIADRLSLTQEEREELLPGGRVTRLRSRVQWAFTYLAQAKLVERVDRGTCQITQRGTDYLRVAPANIRPSDLNQFPEYVEFQRRSNDGGNDGQLTPSATSDGSTPDNTTPAEAIAAAYNTLNEALAQELLDRIKAMPPGFFERLIVQLMLRLGYGRASEEAGQTLGRSGDGGVDGVISQDKLGLEKIYLQAKRWSDNSVGRPDVQAFVGALTGQGATKGVFITTSTFTRDARDYVRSIPHYKISLVDGPELARLMIQHDLGVSLVERYEVKRVDSDFFAEE